MKKELARLSELEFINDFDRDKSIHLVEGLCKKRFDGINKYVYSYIDSDGWVSFEFKAVNNVAGFANDYKVEVKELSIRIIGRKVRGNMCHPHVNPEGEPCFGITESEVLSIFNQDVVAFVALIDNFLSQCNHEGQIAAWREAGALLAA